MRMYLYVNISMCGAILAHSPATLEVPANRSQRTPFSQLERDFFVNRSVPDWEALVTDVLATGTVHYRVGKAAFCMPPSAVVNNATFIMEMVKE